ncbi:phosphotransferase [Thiotrichales bacterium 19S3-7]|nr:phosphotransferase [Thiotrichales bacterium 19S3-7]MCF6800835.1 phosphotransferase [Thiotrichales bacterium 19S3-11]
MTFQRSRLNDWLKGYYDDEKFKIDFLAGDASFRRYYRIHKGEKTYVLMDASSEKEKLVQFIAVGNLFKKNGVVTPEVVHVDVEEGLCLLSDFGNQLLFDVFAKEKENNYYRYCLYELIKINQISGGEVPEYSYEKLIEEAGRMNEWFFEWLKLKPTTKDKQMLVSLFNQLAEVAKVQPQTTLHRDYHSKNIMMLASQSLGIIDYQDAVSGPVVYDLVSLLKDCYISWPKQIINYWVEVYFQMLKTHHVIAEETSFNEFVHWFDWVGMQRHIKCLGIFACLYIRDGRPNYLEHIPRVAHYILSVAKAYPQLKPWLKFWKNEVQPKLDLIDLQKVISKEVI